MDKKNKENKKRIYRERPRTLKEIERGDLQNWKIVGENDGWGEFLDSEADSEE